MPGTGRNPVTGQNYDEGGGGASIRGPLAGQDARFNTANQQQLEQQFLAEKGWAGLGNKKRPADAIWRPLFQQWLAARQPKPAVPPVTSSTPSAPVVIGDESALPNALAGLFG